MKAKNIKTITDAYNFIQGVINDFVEGISTKEETVSILVDYTGRLMELFLENSKKKIKADTSLLNE